MKPVPNSSEEQRMKKVFLDYYPNFVPGVLIFDQQMKISQFHRAQHSMEKQGYVFEREWQKNPETGTKWLAYRPDPTSYQRMLNEFDPQRDPSHYRCQYCPRTAVAFAGDKARCSQHQEVLKPVPSLF
jgi:hypothetical protein